VPSRARRNDDLERLPLQARQQAAFVCTAKLQGAAGVSLAPRGMQHGPADQRRGRRESDAQHVALLATWLGARQCLDLLHQRCTLRSDLQRQVGRDIAPPRSHEERSGVVSLQLLHAVADGRLGDAAGLGSRCEGAVLDDQSKVLQVAQIHKRH
jgi:hypothetical protein